MSGVSGCAPSLPVIKSCARVPPVSAISVLAAALTASSRQKAFMVSSRLIALLPQSATEGIAASRLSLAAAGPRHRRGTYRRDRKCGLGIVNLAARGMLVVSVARRLGSEGPLLACSAAPL
jgi:hypothetical protein